MKGTGAYSNARPVLKGRLRTKTDVTVLKNGLTTMLMKLILDFASLIMSFLAFGNSTYVLTCILNQVLLPPPSCACANSGAALSRY
jgi:hypothetical protein